MYRSIRYFNISEYRYTLSVSLIFMPVQYGNTGDTFSGGASEPHGRGGGEFLNSSRFRVTLWVVSWHESRRCQVNFTFVHWKQTCF